MQQAFRQLTWVRRASDQRFHPAYVCAAPVCVRATLSISRTRSFSYRLSLLCPGIQAQLGPRDKLDLPLRVCGRVFERPCRRHCKARAALNGSKPTAHSGFMLRLTCRSSQAIVSNLSRLAGGGEVGQLVREFDWSKTDMGG